uniref:Uncharacterized protein n=1 Tax=Setaria italica TaxID=4555 RepID=K3YA71_SETIT
MQAPSPPRRTARSPPAASPRPARAPTRTAAAAGDGRGADWCALPSTARAYRSFQRNTWDDAGAESGDERTSPTTSELPAERRSGRRGRAYVSHHLKLPAERRGRRGRSRRRQPACRRFLVARVTGACLNRRSSLVGARAGGRVARRTLTPQVRRWELAQRHHHGRECGRRDPARRARRLSNVPACTAAVSFEDK